MHEIKARRSWTQTSSRSHCCKKDEFFSSLKSCAQIHFRCLKHFKIHDAKAAVEKLEKIRHGSWRKSEIKKEVIEEARNEGRKVQFASLMNLCHLENSELEQKHQKYKGWGVLRGDIVNDDSGSYAVFTSSASQMTAEKQSILYQYYQVAQVKQQTQYTLTPRSKWKMLQNYWKFKRECPDIWIRLPKHKRPKSWSSMEEPVVPLERNLHGHPLAGLLWETVLGSSIGTRLGKVSNWECLFVCLEQGLSLSVCGRYQTGWKKARH